MTYTHFLAVVSLALNIVLFSVLIWHKILFFVHADNQVCVAGPSSHHMFTFKPHPTQYARTLKEAMAVCSMLGGDIPHYVSKCRTNRRYNLERGGLPFNHLNVPLRSSIWGNPSAKANGQHTIICQRKCGQCRYRCTAVYYILL